METENHDISWRHAAACCENGSVERGGKAGEELNGMEELANFFRSQLDSWELARRNFDALRHIYVKTLGGNGTYTHGTDGACVLKAQCNPERIRSTAADIDREAVAKRPCFLCKDNRPQAQTALLFDGDMEICVNPYPIFPIHFTVSSTVHEPQSISRCHTKIFRLLLRYKQLTVIYNGPRCGASAPDHLHLQGGMGFSLPLQDCWNTIMAQSRTIGEVGKSKMIYSDAFAVPLFAITSGDETEHDSLFKKLIEALPTQSGEEPMLNVVAWRTGETVVSAIIPRRKHRPDCYYAADGRQMLISPGAIDMAGLLITPRQIDFDRMTQAIAMGILAECSLDKEQAEAVAADMERIL